MKKTILSIALLLSVTTTLLSSCMVQDRNGRRGHWDHGRHRGHGGPYDSNGYHHYYNNY